LHVVHAWLPFPDHSHPSIAVASDAALYEREAQKILFEELDKVEAAGGASSGGHLERGRPAETISDLAEELEAGLVVVGSRGLGPVMRLVMGSVSEGVIALATCPVLVMRGGEGAWPPSRVVVGDDFSPGAKRAGDLAASIAGIVGASVLLVRAVPMVRDVSEAAGFVEDAASPRQATLGRHELFLASRARRLEEASGLRPRVRVRGEGRPPPLSWRPPKKARGHPSSPWADGSSGSWSV
jgi:nucleotide-binding universal stress UspA family protein